MATARTKEDVGTSSMSEITPEAVGHVTNGKEVKLLLPASTGNVDGEEDRPCYQAANETDDDGNL